MKINDFGEFINEEFFKKVFNQSKRQTPTFNRVDTCVENILNFLAENGVYNWDKFLNIPAPVNGSMFAAHTTQTMTHSIKIISDAGTLYYIMCTNAATNRS